MIYKLKPGPLHDDMIAAEKRIRDLLGGQVFRRKKKCQHLFARERYTSENWPIFECRDCGKEVLEADYE